MIDKASVYVVQALALINMSEIYSTGISGGGRLVSLLQQVAHTSMCDVFQQGFDKPAGILMRIH